MCTVLVVWVVYCSKEFRVRSTLTPRESVDGNVVFTAAWINRLQE